MHILTLTLKSVPSATYFLPKKMNVSQGEKEKVIRNKLVSHMKTSTGLLGGLSKMQDLPGQ